MENNKMNNAKESASRLTDDEIVHMVKEKPGESMLANTVGDRSDDYPQAHRGWLW